MWGRQFFPWQHGLQDKQTLLQSMLDATTNVPLGLCGTDCVQFYFLKKKLQEKFAIRRCVIQLCGSNSWVSNEPSIFWKHISLANTRNFISRREETVNCDVKCMTWCFFLQVFMITRWGQGLGRSWFFPHLLDVWNYRWGCSAWLWGPWFNAHEFPTCLQSFFCCKICLESKPTWCISET